VVADAMGLLKSATNFARRKAEPTPEPVYTPHPISVPTRIEPPAGSGPSILSLNVAMVGSIASPQELHVYGSIGGSVRAASFTVCKGGSIKGDVVAEPVNVHGLVEGRVFAQTAQLFAGATMRGEIVHGALGIDTAAVFEGSVKRTADPLAEAPAVQKKS